jgi:translation initiation factor IF-3
MYPPRYPRPRIKVRENVNEGIRAREVRAVFPDGTVLIMPTNEAIRRAQELGLDLIVVSPTAEPPVAKAMDYGQWQYEQKKKSQEAKKKQHVIEVKEV